jgi:Spy/CpxP family protein refolding chaperone
MEIARKAHQELRAASLAASFDGARVRELADTAAKALADTAVLRAEAMGKVVALLTPEQRAKLEERRARHEERRQRGERR